MFEDLKNELNEIKADDSLKQKIKTKMRQEKSNAPDDKTKLKLIRIRWTAAVAAMVAVCLVAVSVLDTVTNPPVKTGDTGTAAVISSYEEIYDFFEKAYQESERLYGSTGATGEDEYLDTGVDLETGEDIMEEVNPGGAGQDDLNGNSASKPTGNNGANSENDFSGTNTQVEGVDEADIVKTDGQYIYTLSVLEDKINIAKADKGKLTLLKAISLPVSTYEQYNKEGYFFDTRYEDMYIEGGYLIAIGEEVKNEKKTVVAVYDISDPQNIKNHWVYGQEGSYLSSRIYDGKLYLVTNKYFTGRPQKQDLTTYIPSAGSCGNEKPLAAEDICSFEVEPGPRDNKYTVVSGVDYKGTKITDSKAVLGGGKDIYMNNTSLYVAHINSPYYGKQYEESFVQDSTEIIKFAVDKGNVTLTAKGSIPGTLLNQFSMDENEGYFRAVTTIGQFTESYGRYYRMEYTNAVFVLDENLKKVSSIEDLAPDENVYSVRFMGDICYFVTFKQVDPLFAVDLSDVKAPKVLSKLKIPGFSRYMHPWGEGRLLGIGQDANEQTGRTEYLKLSMFDISDPTNVTEENKVIVEGEFESEALYNHKAVLISQGKNLIGFATGSKYYVWGYEEGKGFVKKTELPLSNNKYYGGVRGIFISDTLYVVEEMGITSYSLKDFAKIAQLAF